MPQRHLWRMWRRCGASSSSARANRTALEFTSAANSALLLHLGQRESKRVPDAKALELAALGAQTPLRVFSSSGAQWKLRNPGDHGDWKIQLPRRAHRGDRPSVKIPVAFGPEPPLS